MMENIKYWDEVKDYFFITLGIMLYTISFTVFLMPYQIVAGGVTGLSAIIYYARASMYRTPTSSSTCRCSW